MNQEKWYLLLQKDGSFFIDPDQPQEGTWEIYNDWQEAFNAGMRYQAGFIKPKRKTKRKA